MNRYDSKINRNETLLFCVDDYVPKNHMVRHLDSIVDSIINEDSNFKCFKANKNKTGRRAFNPGDLLKLFIYGYMNRLSASRKLEEECLKNIYLIWLTNGITPSFRTLCYFRENNGDNIEKFFYSFVQKLILNNLVDTRLFATDGVKIKGYVSKPSKNEKELQEYKRMKIEEFKKFIKELREKDESELSPATKRKINKFKNRMAKIKKCEVKIKNGESKYVNPEDPDAVLLNNHGNHFRGYNCQATVESKNKYVVNVRISTNSNDSYELIPTIQSIKDNLGILPEKIVADKGYNTIGGIFKAEDEYNVKIITELNCIEKEKFKGFIYNPVDDSYTCPQNQKLTYHCKKKAKNGRMVMVYNCQNCKNCPLMGKCTTSKRGRDFHRSIAYERETKYRELMSLEKNQKIFKKRKGMIENVFGTIRRRMGYVPLLLRGTRKVTIEIFLYFIGYNITRFVNNMIKSRLINVFNFSTLILFLRSFGVRKTHQESLNL